MCLGQNSCLPLQVLEGLAQRSQQELAPAPAALQVEDSGVPQEGAGAAQACLEQAPVGRQVQQGPLVANQGPLAQQGWHQGKEQMGVVAEVASSPWEARGQLGDLALVGSSGAQGAPTPPETPGT